MGKSFALVLASAVAFLFAAVAAGITIGTGANITEVEGGLLAASVAVILLVIRQYNLEKRLSAMEKLLADDEDDEDEEDGSEEEDGAGPQDPA